METSLNFKSHEYINNSQNLMSNFYVQGNVLTLYMLSPLILLNNSMRNVLYYVYLTYVKLNQKELIS